MVYHGDGEFDISTMNYALCTMHYFTYFLPFLI